MPDAAATGSRLILGFVALGALLIWATTINGAGLQPDSIHYIRMARALGDGESVFSISKHWPPGYPLLLAWFSSGVGAELVTARWIVVLSYVATIGGIGACLQRSTRGRYANYLSVAVLLAVMLSPAFTRVAWDALTEGPFLAAMLWALYATLLLGERYRPWAIGLLSLCIGSMLLLRYSAAPFVLALVMVCAYSALHWTWRQRLQAAGGVLLSFAPLVVWTLLHDSESAPRSLKYHPLTEAHWLQFMDTMSGWLGGLPALLTCVLLPISLTAAALAWWRCRSPALLFCLLIIPGYLLFLFLSISFMDAHTPLDSRILAPLLPLWMLMIAVTVVEFATTESKEIVQLTAVGAFVLVTAIGAPKFAAQAETAIRYGVVFADWRAGDQEIIRHAAQIEEGRVIYTNYNEWLYLLYNRDAQILPALFNPVNMELNPNLVEDMDAMIADLHATDGVVVWVEFIKGRTYLPDPKFMTEQLGMEVVAEMQGGKVLKLKQKGPTLSGEPLIAQ